MSAAQTALERPTARTLPTPSNLLPLYIHDSSELLAETRRVPLREDGRFSPWPFALAGPENHSGLQVDHNVDDIEDYDLANPSWDGRVFRLRTGARA